jgi:hypothetical protein
LSSLVTVNMGQLRIAHTEVGSRAGLAVNRLAGSGRFRIVADYAVPILDAAPKPPPSKRHNPKHATKHDAKHQVVRGTGDVPANAGHQPTAAADLAPIAKAKEGMTRRPFSEH